MERAGEWRGWGWNVRILGGASDPRRAAGRTVPQARWGPMRLSSGRDRRWGVEAGWVSNRYSSGPCFSRARMYACQREKCEASQSPSRRGGVSHQRRWPPPRRGCTPGKSQSPSRRGGVSHESSWTATAQTFSTVSQSPSRRGGVSHLSFCDGQGRGHRRRSQSPSRRGGVSHLRPAGRSLRQRPLVSIPFSSGRCFSLASGLRKNCSTSSSQSPSRRGGVSH